MVAGSTPRWRSGLGPIALGLLLCACSEAEEPSATPGASAGVPATGAPADRGAGTALLDGLDSALLEGRGLEELLGRGESSRAERVLFRDDFDAEADSRWTLGPRRARAGDPGGGGSGPNDPGPRVDGETSLYYLPFAVKELRLELPAPAEADLLVLARVRSLREEAVGALSLEAMVRGAGGALLELPRAVEDKSGRARIETGGEWRTLSLLEPDRPGREALTLSFAPGQGGLALDWVEVRRISKAERLHLEEQSGGEPALRRHWMLGGQSWDCLVMPPPARASFSVPVPSDARLELATGLVSSRDGQALDFRVRVDGKVIAERRHVHGGEGPRETFAPWTVSLEAFAGRVVELGLETAGDDDVLGLVGAPRVLRRRAPRAAGETPNVLLISIDTLRADHLGCYGSALGASPLIDALARAGLRFEEVASPSSYTLPTHVSMFTGQHPLLHGVERSSKRIDPARSWRLGEAMRASGRVCGAFTGGGYVHPAFGYAAGFDTYEVRDPAGVDKAFLTRREFPRELLGEAAEDSLQPTLDWIRRRADQPFFLFLHTFLVHNYVPDAEFAARYVGEEDLGDEGKRLWSRAQGGDAACAQRLRELYAATLAEVDARTLGRLLAFLDEQGLRENTLIALVADHGESFLEHDTLGHGTGLWIEQTQVPWILHGPGVPVGATWPHRVGLEDLAPTLCALAGLPADERWSGHAVDLTSGEAFVGDRLLHLDVPGAHAEALILGSRKVLRSLDERGQPLSSELYHLDSDPRESHDLSETRPDELAQMLRELEAARRRIEDFADRLPRSEQGAGAMSEGLSQALQQLGYMGGEAQEQPQGRRQDEESDGGEEQPRDH